MCSVHRVKPNMTTLMIIRKILQHTQIQLRGDQEIEWNVENIKARNESLHNGNVQSEMGEMIVEQQQQHSEKRDWAINVSNHILILTHVVMCRPIINNINMFGYTLQHRGIDQGRTSSFLPHIFHTLLRSPLSLSVACFVCTSAPCVHSVVHRL